MAEVYPFRPFSSLTERHNKLRAVIRGLFIMSMLHAVLIVSTLVQCCNCRYLLFPATVSKVCNTQCHLKQTSTCDVTRFSVSWESF